MKKISKTYPKNIPEYIKTYIYKYPKQIPKISQKYKNKNPKNIKKSPTKYPNNPKYVKKYLQVYEDKTAMHVPTQFGNGLAKNILKHIPKISQTYPTHIPKISPKYKKIYIYIYINKNKWHFPPCLFRITFFDDFHHSFLSLSALSFLYRSKK